MSYDDDKKFYDKWSLSKTKRPSFALNHQNQQFKGKNVESYPGTQPGRTEFKNNSEFKR